MYLSTFLKRRLNIMKAVKKVPSFLLTKDSRFFTHQKEMFQHKKHKFERPLISNMMIDIPCFLVYWQIFWLELFKMPTYIQYRKTCFKKNSVEATSYKQLKNISPL